MQSTSLLMFSPEFSLERDLCNTFVLSFHTWNEKQNLIICRQVNLGNFRKFNRVQITVVNSILF